MSFGADLLAEARTLSNAISSSATRRRTVIGRAYYAAYHELLGYAITQGYSPAGRSVHAQLRDWLQLHGNPDVRRAGDIMEQMRKLRVDADYKPQISISIQDARDALENAGEIIEEIALDLADAP